MAIQNAPRAREKPFPAFLGKKQFRPSRVSAFCALCPRTAAAVAFKAPTSDTRVARAKRKRKAEEAVVAPPKVARVTRSSSRKVVPEESVRVAEEQERRDFELAKKLQCELKGTVRSRNSTASATSGYSLRSKRKSAERMNSDPPLRRTTRRTKAIL